MSIETPIEPDPEPPDWFSVWLDRDGSRVWLSFDDASYTRHFTRAEAAVLIAELAAHLAAEVERGRD